MATMSKIEKFLGFKKPYSEWSKVEKRVTGACLLLVAAPAVAGFIAAKLVREEEKECSALLEGIHFEKEDEE